MERFISQDSLDLSRLLVNGQSARHEHRDPLGLHICATAVVGDTPEQQVWVVMEYENLAALDAAIEAAILAVIPEAD